MSNSQIIGRPPLCFEGVLYTAYGDESADETQQRVFAIAGLFGSKNDWEVFREKWRRRNRGKIFHASDCETGNGDYENTDHHENLKLYKDLTNIIADSPLLGNAVAVSIPDFEELLARSVYENSYYLCFHHVVINLAKRSYFCIPRDRIKFTFDRNVKLEHNASALYDRIVNDECGKAEFRKLMEDEVGFATRKTIGIQAADLVAREAMKLLDNRFTARPTRLSTQSLQASKRIQFRVYDRAWCEDLIRDTNEVSYPLKEYSDWLNQKGLSNTLSNKLRYEESREQH